MTQLTSNITNRSIPKSTDISLNTVPSYAKFIVSGLGGASGWCCIHPMDVIKTRLQIREISGGTVFSTIKSMVREEGLFSIYSGISAGITRQLTYTTLRLGLYDILRSKFTVKDKEIELHKKLAIGLTSGGIASGLCNPIEVALVRLQSDGSEKNIALQRNYKHVFNAMVRVINEEGFIVLYRGVKPTILRGMMASMVQLASYDHFKYNYQKLFGLNSNNPLLHFISGISSGYLCSIAVLPFDIAKVRMQNERTLANGKVFYRNIPQSIGYIIRNEGFFALWKGFWPFFARSGGHTVFMFLFVEQYRQLAKWTYNAKEY